MLCYSCTAMASQAGKEEEPDMSLELVLGDIGKGLKTSAQDDKVHLSLLFFLEGVNNARGGMEGRREEGEREEVICGRVEGICFIHFISCDTHQ